METIPLKQAQPADSKNPDWSGHEHAVTWDFLKALIRNVSVEAPPRDAVSALYTDSASNVSKKFSRPFQVAVYPEVSGQRQ